MIERSESELDASFFEIDDNHFSAYMAEVRSQDREAKDVSDVADYYKRRADVHVRIADELANEGHTEVEQFYRDEAKYLQKIVDDISGGNGGFAYGEIVRFRDGQAKFVITRTEALEKAKGPERELLLNSEMGPKYIENSRAAALRYESFAFLIAEAKQISHAPLKLD